MGREYNVPDRLKPNFSRAIDRFIEEMNKAYPDAPFPTSLVADDDPSVKFDEWLDGSMVSGKAVMIRYLNEEQFRYFAPYLMSITLDRHYFDEAFSLASLLWTEDGSLPRVVALLSKRQLSLIRQYLELMRVQGHRWAARTLEQSWKSIPPIFPLDDFELSIWC